VVSKKGPAVSVASALCPKELKLQLGSINGVGNSAGERICRDRQYTVALKVNVPNFNKKKKGMD